jgi:NAD(P)-dependent dehydrogenase (short-subunit alcohol dehydrogenase family)
VISSNGASAVPDVAIVGATGALGFGLAVRLAAAGLSVAIGSRDEDRAIEAAARARMQVPRGNAGWLAQRAGRGCRPGSHSQRAFPLARETLVRLRSVMRSGQLVIDATVPLAALPAANRRPCSVSGRGPRRSKLRSWSRIE